MDSSPVAVNKKEGFSVGILGILGATLLGNLLAGKGIARAGEDTVTADEGTITAG